METLFLRILNMSITAGWIVPAVIILRLILRKAPKWISCLLWALVGVRLVLPFSIESVLSLIPSKETIPPEIITSSAPVIHSGINYFNHTVNPIISDALAPDPVKGTAPVVTIVGIATLVWLVGILAMLGYSAASYLKIRKRVKVSIKAENNIYICDSINTPFIFGIINPKIYLPSTLSKEDSQYVLAHERAHLKRRDHLIKPFGFLLLSVYWFNPVLWLGYILLCRDIELACDEKVMKNSDIENKKSYSTALLNCSIPRKLISSCPLAFGEVGVKKRIKKVLNYKKPAFWIIVVALIISIVASVCLLTNPVEDSTGIAPDTTVNITTIEPIIEHNTEDYVQYHLLMLDGDTDVPYVRLYPDDNRFEFMLHRLSSYLPIGTYTIESDKLTLECDGEDTNKYVFRIRSSNSHTSANMDYIDPELLKYCTLEFIADESSELPKFKYYANDTEVRPPFEDKAWFVSTSTVNYCYDTISYDIDRDGNKENISLTIGPTYGRLTFGINITKYGKKIYNTIFEAYWEDPKFTVHDDKLYLKGTTIDKPYTEEEIEIRWKNDFLCFIKDGFPYGYEYEPSYSSAAETIKRYINAYDTRNVELLNSCFTEPVIDLKNKDAVNTLINTVTGCRLIEVEFDAPNLLNTTARITYEITYSEDYIPTGNRLPGKNLITCTYNLKNINGEYLISETGVESVEH